MRESQFIGTLMPSHPDFQPIIPEIREKYKLPEIDPDGEPIKKIYLRDETIPLANFLHQAVLCFIEAIHKLGLKPDHSCQRRAALQIALL